MPTLKVDAAAPDPAAIARAAEIIRRGGLVAFPTETVYGLGAHALDPEAIGRIYEAKGRPSYNPLIVHVATEEGAKALAAAWPPSAAALAHAFWPGPLTLVLPKRAIVPDAVTAGLDSVAIRVPAHPVALALLRAAGVPIAAPSANRSTELSPTTAVHVERALGARVDLILDGGPTTVGIESTVVDLRRERPAILRPGLLGARELEPVVGPLAPPNRAPVQTNAGEAPVAHASPGQMDRHYAPRARLTLCADETREQIIARTRALRATGTRATALIRETDGAASDAPDGDAAVVVLPDDAAGYARRLYGVLHALDDAGCEIVLVEPVPRGAPWDGVRDRLARAAT